MNENLAHKIRTTVNPHEPPMQASKWIKCPMLIDGDEMESLIKFLKPFYIFITGTLTEQGHGEISTEEFLKKYREYIEELSKGIIPNESLYRTYFSSIFTTTLDAVYALIVEGEKQLIRISKPIIQLQTHRLHYSDADQTFRSMSFGSEGISWGIQFSYPQLFQDGQTQEIGSVNIDSPNTKLFRLLQRWMRDNTIPTPFIVEGQKINIPARLGKQCLPWINKHPQLVLKGFQVCEAT